MKIACPVVGCKRLIAVKSTFTSHMSVKHGQLIRLHLDPALIQREMEELPLCLPHCGDSSECDTNVQCDDVPTANIFQT